MKTIDVLNKYKSDTASKWHEEAEYRRKNARWLRYSAMIALQVRDRMSQIGMTQVVLAFQEHGDMLLGTSQFFSQDNLSHPDLRHSVPYLKNYHGRISEPPGIFPTILSLFTPFAGCVAFVFIQDIYCLHLLF